ncbi:hypothetical protein MUP07_01480 [Candidatus Bathyarchaeota archaeon]|nr:hypothetical protein [Candidatus Bathyarchaeota archaeon]
MTVVDLMLVGGTKCLVIRKKLTLPSWKELFEHGERFAERGHITRQQILMAVKDTRRRRWSHGRSSDRTLEKQLACGARRYW